MSCMAKLPHSIPNSARYLANAVLCEDKAVFSKPAKKLSSSAPQRTYSGSRNTVTHRGVRSITVAALLANQLSVDPPGCFESA